MNPCQEKSGFLFSHACPQQSTSACQRCSKAVCAQHLHPTPGGYCCTTCAKEEAKRARAQNQSWQGWDDSPYLYDTYYYHGYGYYRRGYWGHGLLEDDFTEADGASFEEGEGQWEQDMGAS